MDYWRDAGWGDVLKLINHLYRDNIDRESKILQIFPLETLYLYFGTFQHSQDIDSSTGPMALVPVIKSESLTSVIVEPKAMENYRETVDGILIDSDLINSRNVYTRPYNSSGERRIYYSKSWSNRAKDSITNPPSFLMR